MRNNRRLLGALIPLAVLLVGGYILYQFDPIKSGFYPKCVFHEFTGLYCPGCGAARAFHALIHGDFLAALDYNPLLVIALPVIIIMIILEVVGWFRNRRYGLFHMWQAVALVALIVAYTVLRNLPVEPFTYLAP